MKEIIFFTDGSTLNNQSKKNRKGGIGVFFGDNDPRNISEILNNATNQVTELTACIKGIEKLISTQFVIGKQVVIYTDSMYIVNMMSSWATNWSKNNWKKSDGKTVKNLDLVKRLFYLSKNIGIIFRHVRSHQKEPSKDSEKYFTWYGNDQADKLATGCQPNSHPI